jgi:hypothetical protein
LRASSFPKSGRGQRPRLQDEDNSCKAKAKRSGAAHRRCFSLNYKKGANAMEYLIVFGTAAMIALYATIIGRCLPKT